MLRALITEAWHRPDSEFQRMTDELDAHVRDALERLLRARSGEFAHPSPKRAARVGMLMLDATIREAVLFATDRGGPLGVRDAQLRRELTAPTSPTSVTARTVSRKLWLCPPRRSECPHRCLLDVTGVRVDSGQCGNRPVMTI